MTARPWMTILALVATGCRSMSPMEATGSADSMGYRGYATSPPAPMAGGAQAKLDRERYARIDENDFRRVEDEPLSTFAVDVDTASYANVRRFLTDGQLPPPDAVRIEELVNYFDYAYSAPTGPEPFSVAVEVADCPWAGDRRLVRIGLKGREIPLDRRPPANLVFLIDVSGSMADENKLPLLARAFRLLVERLGETDRVAIVVYAGASGLALPPTSGANRDTILEALGELESGGSTNGGEGIRLAYDVAAENFVQGGTNRVILATDGDFNVGTTSEGELTRLIEEKAATGVFLTVLGFGMGNYNDSGLEALADRGNGNYAYVDSLNEGRKVLVEQMAGTLLTIAKDVKIQVEFNPRRVAAYRLIGYENRVLANQDFEDDRKDAGDIGSGHTVTALYEVVPAGSEVDAPPTGDLRYQEARPLAVASESEELFNVRVRYKEPDGATSRLLEVAVVDAGRTLGQASPDFRFASAVAAFGMVLRGSEHKGSASYDLALELAGDSIGPDANGWRAEFLELVREARGLGSS